MKYRKEIDGLRAVAVLPVVAYHAGFDWMPGGFTGVDVFFVISGYLITRIILDEINGGSFSLLRFYERRVRRILPALLLVVAATVVGSYFLALPSQAEQASQSAIYALLSVSNFHFWSQSGYFAPATEFMPLLHTWSLGVEEQFYLLFPLFLLVVAHFKWNIAGVLVFILLLAFALAVWLSWNKPAVAFYLLPARAWELGLGAVLATGIVPRIGSALVRNAISIVGLSAIVFGMLWITSARPFPGYVALLPCLGAAFILHCADPQTLVGRLLSIRPFVFIGLISYSLYLWHWPILTFSRMYFATIDLPVAIAASAILLSGMLAVVSWKLIERPLRNQEYISSTVFALSLVTSAGAIVAVSVAGIASGGWPNRLSAKVTAIASAALDRDPLNSACSGFIKYGRVEECVFGAVEEEPSYVILGDSHAGAIRPAFDHVESLSDRAGSLWYLAGCPFLLGSRRVPDVDHDDCENFRHLVLKALENSPEIKTVYVVNRWAPILSGVLPEVGGSYRIELIDDQSEERSQKETMRVFERSLDRTINQLNGIGKAVVLVSGVLEPGYDVPTVLALAQMHGATNSSASAYDYHERTNVIIDELFSIRAKENNLLEHISLYEAFCAPDCHVSINGVPLFYDDDHVAASAARSILPRYLEAMVN